MVSMPNPETIPRLRAGPVAGKVPNCISMSVDGVMVTVPRVSAMRSNSRSVSMLPCT
jgi:hypothetical protein